MWQQITAFRTTQSLWPFLPETLTYWMAVDVVDTCTDGRCCSALTTPSFVATASMRVSSFSSPVQPCSELVLNCIKLFRNQQWLERTLGGNDSWAARDDLLVVQPLRRRSFFCFRFKVQSVAVWPYVNCPSSGQISTRECRADARLDFWHSPCTGLKSCSGALRSSGRTAASADPGSNFSKMWCFAPVFSPETSLKHCKAFGVQIIRMTFLQHFRKEGFPHIFLGHFSDLWIR